MKRSSYRERDYTFGQVMLTLRNTMGLNQAGLAQLLGVSRYAVGDWESGDKYPKVEHLKKFIALAVQQKVFPAGQEAEEIRTLWQLAHQKALLDERWLAALLSPTSRLDTDARVPAPTAGTPRRDWGDALSVSAFYGREQEVEQLTEWVIHDRCWVVSVLGQGGIGKSALAVTLMHRVAEHFDVVIWRSLRDAPACEALLDGCLQVLMPQPQTQTAHTLEERLQLFLEHLRGQRALVVLDNLESILEEGDVTGRMRAGYEGYARLLQRVGETAHQSCLLLTSREKPIQLAPLEGSQSRVRTLRIASLEVKPCERLLAEKGITGTESEQARLSEAYAGNPLALKIVAQTIMELFNGEITLFLEQGEVIFGGVHRLLNEQFARLSRLEQDVMVWLAILREPSTLADLRRVLIRQPASSVVLEAIESLSRRSLIEQGHTAGSFTLQSVVLEYVTARLIAEASSEVQEGSLSRLIEHSLELAHAREYVRQTQERLIATPILVQLHGAYPQQVDFENQLLRLLEQLRATFPEEQGYGPANIIALLRLRHGNLRGLDLSRLTLHGAYLQGVEMQDATLSEALIQDSVFSETFDVMTAVAISSTGNFWAAASRSGEIRLWDAGGLAMSQSWRAHADMVWGLSFSPDGRALVSGSWDSLVKLWDIDNGVLLWSARHTSHVNSIAFAPDGRMLASSGNDATVRVWDRYSGAQLQALEHPGPVIAVAWSPDGSLIATGDMEGYIRLWELQQIVPALCVQTIAGHTNWVDGLAFSPDSGTLASASWDGTVRLWDVASGHLHESLTGHTDRVRRVAWSPDGRLIASGGFEQTILIWDVEQGSYQAAIRGHNAGVDGLAFTPDSLSLFSGIEDGTLRLWNTTTGQCVRIIHGYVSSLYDVDWSPDSAQLVSGGTDMTVTVYDVTGSSLPRVLQGHTGFVFNVGWSSDGRWLASSEWDNFIRLWDSTTGECVQVLHHADDTCNYYGLAWSPDGQRLASGTYRRGIQIFEMTTSIPRSAEHLFPTWIRPVAWSPDGARVAGGANDGAVYVWDTQDKNLFQQLPGHHHMVTSIAWSPDGTRLASGSSSAEGGELIIWDVQASERLASLERHPGIVYAVVWDTHGDLMVSGASDGMLRWWNIERGECLRTRKGHQGTVQALSRSPDGTKLASCGDDGAIMLWDMSSGEHLQTLRRDRPYERLNIGGIKGLSDAQKTNLRALGAVEYDGV